MIQMEVVLKASLGNTYYGESGISQNMLSSDSPNRLKLGHSLCFPTPLYLYKVGNPPSRSFDVLQGSLHRRPIAVQYRRRRFIGQDVLNRATSWTILSVVKVLPIQFSARCKCYTELDGASQNNSGGLALMQIAYDQIRLYRQALFDQNASLW